MLREYTCIICPNGCEIKVRADGKEVLSIEGALCPKGREYVTQEMTDPQRNIASSVLVKNGELPLASVRLSQRIPKDRIFDVMKEIRKVKLEAPVKAGQVAIHDVLGLGSDVIVTKNVGAI
ncbi:Molybdopterin oxidoreductase [Ruminococcaceae bacterium BL-6]|nr:Molybdopterin oxidoreductase [Ruminococcaceae bacterium BL-6]